MFGFLFNSTLDPIKHEDDAKCMENGFGYIGFYWFYGVGDKGNPLLFCFSDFYCLFNGFCSIFGRIFTW